MDPRRAATERNAHFTRGPRFFRAGGDVMFEFVIDATNVIGPRKANDGDRRNYAAAWAHFSERDEPLVEPPRHDAEEIKPIDVAHVEAIRNPAQEHDQGQPRAKRPYVRRKPLLSEGI